MAKKIIKRTAPTMSSKDMLAHIEQLRLILAKGSVGDFWSKVEIPSKQDEFTELYVGIELMFEVIREKYAELEGLNAIPAERRDLWKA